MATKTVRRSHSSSQARAASQPFPADPHRPERYAVSVTDDDLNPRFRVGEYIITDRSTPVRPGDEVLVTLKDGRTLPRFLQSQADGLVSLEDIQGRQLTVPEGEVLSLHVITAVGRRDFLVEQE
jgi:hypothetical protein